MHSTVIPSISSINEVTSIIHICFASKQGLCMYYVVPCTVAVQNSFSVLHGCSIANHDPNLLSFLSWKNSPGQKIDPPRTCTDQQHTYIATSWNPFWIYFRLSKKVQILRTFYYSDVSYLAYLHCKPGPCNENRYSLCPHSHRKNLF